MVREEIPGKFSFPEESRFSPVFKKLDTMVLNQTIHRTTVENDLQPHRSSREISRWHQLSIGKSRTLQQAHSWSRPCTFFRPKLRATSPLDARQELERAKGSSGTINRLESGPNETRPGAECFLFCFRSKINPDGREAIESVPALDGPKSNNS